MDIQKQSTANSRLKRGRLRFDDRSLLFLSAAVTMLAFIGIVDLIWPSLRFIARFALVYALVFSLALLAVSFLDLIRSGLNLKRAIALMLLFLSFGLTALALHEAWAQNPFFKTP